MYGPFVRRELAPTRLRGLSKVETVLYHCLHTPQVPPSFAQCLQYLQFLQALQGSSPVQVAKLAELPLSSIDVARAITNSSFRIPNLVSIVIHFLGFFVPFLPVSGLTFPLADQLSDSVEFSLVRSWDRTTVPFVFVYVRT